jgi:cytochrome c553
MEAGIMRTAAKVCLLVALMGMALPVQGGDAAAGKARAASCVACHGEDGISPNPSWPNLAGQQKGYLIREMQYFRDGVRGDAMMTPMAKTLSDEDVENLAEYYSGLCACMEAPIPIEDAGSETAEP